MNANVVKQVRALRLQRDAAWHAHCAADSAGDEVVVELFGMAADGPGNSEAAEAARARYESQKVAASEALGRFIEITQELERLHFAMCGAGASA